MLKGPKTVKCNNRILWEILFSYIWQFKWNKFCKRQALPQFTQEEIDNLSSPISINKIEFLVKNLLTKKSPDIDCFTVVLPKEETVSFIYRSQEIKERNTSQLILGGHRTLIGKDTTKKKKSMTKKEKYEKRETNIVVNKMQRFSVKY